MRTLIIAILLPLIVSCSNLKIRHHHNINGFVTNKYYNAPFIHIGNNYQGPFMNKRKIYEVNSITGILEYKSEEVVCDNEYGIPASYELQIITSNRNGELTYKIIQVSKETWDIYAIGDSIQL